MRSRSGLEHEKIAMIPFVPPPEPGLSSPGVGLSNLLAGGATSNLGVIPGLEAGVILIHDVEVGVRGDVLG